MARIDKWNSKYILKEISRRFEGKGYEIYAVGGFVRDYFLDKKASDIDMTTNARPPAVKSILSEFGSTYNQGEEYGTIGLNFEGKTIEVTTYRGEVYPSASRKPKVVFGNEIFEDLYRRDFTVNSLAMNMITGKVFDPFGGVEDIKNQVIRCVGGKTRFDEDPLRMMRAIRFAVQLNFRLEVSMDHPERLAIISSERIRDEFIKILTSKNPVRGIELLIDYGLMEYIMPEFLELQNVSQNNFHIKDAFGHTMMVLDKISRMHGNKLILRMSALLHDIGKPGTKTIGSDGNVHFYSHQDLGSEMAIEILTRLRFDSDFIEKVSKLISLHMYPILLDMSLNLRTVMRLVRKVGEDDIFLLLALMKADLRSTRKPRYQFVIDLTKLIKEAIKEKPTGIDSPINGDEIMERFHIPPGKLIGEIKQALIEQVIDGTLQRDDKISAFEMGMRYLQGRINNAPM